MTPKKKQSSEVKTIIRDKIMKMTCANLEFIICWWDILYSSSMTSDSISRVISIAKKNNKFLNTLMNTPAMYNHLVGIPQQYNRLDELRPESLVSEIFIISPTTRHKQQKLSNRLKLNSFLDILNQELLNCSGRQFLQSGGI